MRQKYILQGLALKLLWDSNALLKCHLKQIAFHYVQKSPI